MGKWRNHSVTGRAILFFLLSISNACAHTPVFFSLQAEQKYSGAPRSRVHCQSGPESDGRSGHWHCEMEDTLLAKSSSKKIHGKGCAWRGCSGKEWLRIGGHHGLNCLSSVLDLLGKLVARVKRAAPAEGPRTRARTKAAASEAMDASSQTSDRTAAALLVLLAEGAPGRTLQLLTSDGVCDSSDPAVLARLRELHPQADGPGLAAPFPKNRPDIAPS